MTTAPLFRLTDGVQSDPPINQEKNIPKVGSKHSVSILSEKKTKKQIHVNPRRVLYGTITVHSTFHYTGRQFTLSFTGTLCLSVTAFMCYRMNFPFKQSLSLAFQRCHGSFLCQQWRKYGRT